MYESISRDDRVKESSEEILMRKIQDKLGQNNYLLILDDIWNEERQKWEALRNCLLGISANKGNRVLVTTRSENVAAVMAHTKEHIYCPKELEDDECWAIIKQRAFGSSSVSHEFEVLEAVGEKISKRCKGVPLIASLIGATLQNLRDVHEWQSILKNQVWRSLEMENGILDIIKFSYDRLPELALKQCFAFCSIFPEDAVMEREVLIQLWMVEGFLQPPEQSSLQMEDIGDKYFRYLLKYSLFQEEERDRLGRVTSCRMHDLIHDFVDSISDLETVVFCDEESGNNISAHIRHLNLNYVEGMMPTVSGNTARIKLRTLFSKHDIPISAQSDLKRLRVLNVCDASDVEKLPKCFGNSKSLRYLDISGTKVREFPEFIRKLYNLQTFRFMDCKSLQMPPGGIGNLMNLRHVYFSDEECMPANLGKLTNLQTLRLFFVGKTKGHRIEELGSLSRLKGRLDIRRLELVEGKSEAESAKLHEKTLDEMILSWSRNEDGDDEDVLEGLRPHPNLRGLSIEGFGGKSLPLLMLKSECSFLCNNLVVLKFESCTKLKSIPVMGGFSSLQKLYVKDCKDLTDGAFAFPSLIKLSIENCPSLESFSNRGLPSLEKLKISYCGVVNIDNLSTCARLKDFVLSSCPNLKICPDLLGLSFLQKLSIQKNDELVCLPSGLSSCTALEVLLVYDCPNLTSIPEELKSLCSLSTLEICYCSKLISFPEDSLGFLSSLKTLKVGGFSNEYEEFPGFGSINNLSTSLEELQLYGWENITRLPHQIQALTALKKLHLEHFDGVEALPEWLGSLFSLKTLCVYFFSGLKSLQSGLPSCTSLENLDIQYCNNLISVPRELKELRSLVKLKILQCPKLRSFSRESLGYLTCLKSLWIGRLSEDLEEFIGLRSIHHLHASLEVLFLIGWEKLVQLPEEVQHLTALRELSISNFSGLEALPDWLGKLPSLQSLYIYRCKNLKLLPSTEAIIKRLSESKQFQLHTDWPELREKVQEQKRSSCQNH